MKKYLLIFLLLIPFSHGYFDKVIFNNWLQSGEYIEIDNELYRAIYIRASNTTVVYFPNGLTAVITLRNTSCTQEWLYSVCQHDMKFQKDGINVPPDINDPYINISLRLNINFTKLELDLIKDMNTSMYVGDSIPVRSVINKTGKMDITNILFVDQYSDDFVIENVLGCIQSRNAIYWKGDLNQSSIHYCTYTIKPLKNVTYKNFAQLTYFVVGKEQQKNYTYDLKIDSTTFILGVHYLDGIYEAGNSLKINLSLKAIEDIMINKLTIEAPAYFNILNHSPELRKQNSVVSNENWNLKAGNITQFFFQPQTNFVGNHTINVTVRYTYKNVIKETTKQIPLRFGAPTFYVSLMEKGNETKLLLTNPSKDYFQDIEIRIDSYVYRVQRLDSKRFKEFSMPSAINKSHEVNVTYKTKFGQILEQKHYLAFGQTSRVEPINIEKLVEQLEEPVKQAQTIQKPTLDFKIDINPKIFLYIGGIALVLIIGYALISFVKSRKGGISIEKELEKLEKDSQDDDEKISI